MGYVGLTLAVAMAEAGFRVFGVERDPKVLSALAKGRAHFSEAGLDAVLAEQIARGQFTFSDTISAEADASVYIITVGTPIDEGKRTRFDGLLKVCSSIAEVLKDDDLVILRSTVRVGTCRDIVKPRLDAASKRYALAFCPERTLEGKALLELRSLPQVVGGADSTSTQRASEVFSFITSSIVRVNDLETAEMVKLVSNTQRDFIFAFANEVAAMCDVIGVSAVEVIRSGNLGYPRANLPLPGPVGGPCLEKDPYILAEGFEQHSFTPSLALAGRSWNEGVPGRAVEALKAVYLAAGRSPRRIAVLGLAFKGRPATDDLRGSVAIRLIALLKAGFPQAELVGWDPIVSSESIESLGISPTRSLEDAFERTDLVLLQNNHSTFEKMHLPSLAGLMSDDGVIYDFWNQHNPRNLDLARGVTYRGLGSFNLARGSAPAR